MPTCKTCGENLYGDGYKTVYHCPNAIEQKDAEIEIAEPDANPIYCTMDE
jgi:hypothetical protein